MPAIHIDRLVQQIQIVFNPQLPGLMFRENFKSLLEVHANLAYRAGIDVQRKSLTPKLQLTPIVTHHITQQFSNLIKTNPLLALEYADHIWMDEIYETKYFAALVLGLLPSDYFHLVIDRFVSWGSKTSDKEIHQILFKNGSLNIRKSKGNLWLETISNWIDSTESSKTITAIYALQSQVNDPDFINLPKVFKIITPIFSMNNRKITSGLTSLVDDLAKVNPVETSHFLSSLLLGSSHSSAKLITRKCLQTFPMSEQKKLRIVLSNIQDDEN